MKNTIYQFILLLCLGLLATSCANESDNKSFVGGDGSNNGQGGSMARFALAGNYLYTVTNSDLTAYKIDNPEAPQKTSTTNVGINIETIFPYQDKLFIGSQTGMYIYSRLNPEVPSFISRYDHIQACDPVVAQGDLAYVTLRSGTDCRFGTNLLDVIDISNVASPTIIRSLPMLNPHGLGVDGNLLFVCEGEHGLKVFSLAEDARDPQLIQFIQDIKTYDVIPRNGLLIVTGEDGIFQYQYSQQDLTLTLLSQLL